MYTNALTSVNLPEVSSAKQLLSFAAIQPVSCVLGATLRGTRYLVKVDHTGRLVDGAHLYTPVALFVPR